MTVNKEGYGLLGFKWSTEPPTEPGWYWVEVGGYVVREKITMARINIVDGRASIDYPVNGYEFENDFEVSEVTHWLGPIPQPKRPQS